MDEILTSYQKTVYKVSVFTAILAFLRIPLDVLIMLIYRYFRDAMSADEWYILNLLTSLLFLQIIPSIIGGAMFGLFKNGGRRIKELYRPPKRLAKAMLNLPAVYGFGTIVNIVTVVITLMFSERTAESVKNITPVIGIAAPDVDSSWVLFFITAFAAPLFEEFVFRGVLLQALKPYGNGLAVVYTAVFFGLYHGNLSQCFYTAAVGLALGYIADVTDSLLPTTLIHICLNGVAGVMLMMLSFPSVKLFLFSLGRDGGGSAEVLMFAAYAMCVAVFAVVGMFLAILKLKKLKKYKVKKVCAEISNGTKVKMLLLNVPMALAALLLLDTFLGFSAAIITMIFRGG